MRRWVVVVVMLTAAMPTAPVSAQDAAYVGVGMPVDGDFDGYDQSDPSVHNKIDDEDWATDLGAFDAPVHAHAGPASGDVELAVVNAVEDVPCGEGGPSLGGVVEVELTVDGVALGAVRYVHLVAIPDAFLVPGPHPIADGTVVGRTAPSPDTFAISDCWQVFGPDAVHVHIAIAPLAAHGCYRTDNQGPGVAAGAVIGVLGADYADGERQPCPALPDTGPAVASRLAGATRQHTSAVIAQTAYPDGAIVVWLASAERGLALALAAGAEAFGPTLLVPDRIEDVAPEIREAIAAIDPGQVTSLGAPGAEGIPAEVLEELASGRQEGGLWGADVYDSAALLVNYTGPPRPRVYLAEAVRLADGLAGGTLRGGPILLVPSDGALPDSVAEAIASVDPQEVVALGGTAAISEDILQAAAAGRPTQRLAGTTRFETAEAVALEAFPLTAGRVYLARADIAPDAAVGGALNGGPILLVENCDAAGAAPPIHPATARQLERLQPAEVIALGGTGAVCDAVLEAATELAS